MSRAASIVTYSLLAVWTLVCLFPLYWVAVTSFKSGAAIMEGPYFLPFADFTPSTVAWSYILTDAHDNLLRRFANSGLVAFISTLLCLVFGGMAAYGFTRFRLRWISAGTLMAVLLASRVLPPVVLVIPLYFMAAYSNLLDTPWALIITYTAINLPVAVWLLRPVFGLRASEQEEAALLDGASRLRIFFEIVVPMAAAAMVAVGLFIFVLCWNEYLFAAYLAGDKAMTVPPWVVGQLSMREAQVGGDAEEWANLSAAMVLMTAPLVLFAGVAQRALSRLASTQQAR